MAILSAVSLAVKAELSDAEYCKQKKEESAKNPKVEYPDLCKKRDDAESAKKQQLTDAELAAHIDVPDIVKAIFTGNAQRTLNIFAKKPMLQIYKPEKSILPFCGAGSGPLHCKISFPNCSIKNGDNPSYSLADHAFSDAVSRAIDLVPCLGYFAGTFKQTFCNYVKNDIQHHQQFAREPNLQMFNIFNRDFCNNAYPPIQQIIKTPDYLTQLKTKTTKQTVNFQINNETDTALKVQIVPLTDPEIPQTRIELGDIAPQKITEIKQDVFPNSQLNIFDPAEQKFIRGGQQPVASQGAYTITTTSDGNLSVSSPTARLSKIMVNNPLDRIVIFAIITADKEPKTTAVEPGSTKNIYFPGTSAQVQVSDQYGMYPDQPIIIEPDKTYQVQAPARKQGKTTGYKLCPGPVGTTC